MNLLHEQGCGDGITAAAKALAQAQFMMLVVDGAVVSTASSSYG